MDNNSYEPLKSTVDDHEKRIRQLEKSAVEMRYELLNISKNQSDIKTTLLEVEKAQTKQLNNFMQKLFEILEDSVLIKNKNELEKKIIDRKEVWGIVALLIGILATYLLK